MDPDACLALMNSLVTTILADDDAHPDAYRLAELMDALDGWLKRGGFLPARWNQHRPVRK